MLKKNSTSDRNLDEVKRLIAKGVNVNCINYDKRTSLHVVAYNGCLKIV